MVYTLAMNEDFGQDNIVQRARLEIPKTTVELLDSLHNTIHDKLSITCQHRLHLPSK